MLSYPRGSRFPSHRL
ncbi:hypothetical protein F3J37_18930 [Pantoea sp. Al-1710]|uniref:Uncharacterized protein n=1 Tax=Candidatus Pantoea communis TaxID=2608354 RepID=A0ABX0RW38_9GAMM|nr:hypothetical protein [Pantoea communis]